MVSEEGIEKALEDIETLKKENKALRGKLQKLSAAHDAVAAEQKQALLRTERRLATHIILTSFSIAALRLPETVLNQLSATATAYNTRVDTSNDPIPLADEFHGKCIIYQQKLGVRTLNLG